MDYIETVSGNVLEYNSQEFLYDLDPAQNTIIDCLTNSTQVAGIYEAIHIDSSTKSPVFQFSSPEVAAAYKADGLTDYTWYYSYLIDIGYPLIVMAGEYDMKDGANGQTKWMKNNLKGLSSNFWKQDRSIYYYEENNEMKVGGYFRS